MGPILLAALLLLAGGEAAFGGDGHGASLKEHGYYLVNFLVFLGLVYVLAGDRIKAAVRARSKTVGEEIREAGAVLDDAHLREEEAKVALDAMPAREEEIGKKYAAEGDRLAEAILVRTGQEKLKLREAAEATAEAERTAVRRALSRELAEMTLDEAERLIKACRITMDEGRLFEGFVAGLRAREEGGS